VNIRYTENPVNLPIWLLLILVSFLPYSLSHGSEALGRMVISTSSIECEGIRITEELGSIPVSRLQTRIVEIDGKPALRFRDYAPLGSLSFENPLTSTVAALKFQIWIDPQDPPDGSFGLTYSPGLGRKNFYRYQSFESLAHGKWVTWTVWLPYPGNRPGAKVWTLWHIPRKFRSFHMGSKSPTSKLRGIHAQTGSAGKIYLHSVERVLPPKVQVNAVKRARKKYPSLFRQTWSVALLVLAAIFLIGSILARASTRVSMIFLGGFLLPALAALGYLIYAGRSTLMSLEQARIYEAESILTRQFNRVARLQDRIEQRFQSELFQLLAKIQEFLEKGRKEGRNFHKNYEDEAYSKKRGKKRHKKRKKDPKDPSLDPLDRFLVELATVHGLEVLITNGKATFYASRNSSEVTKATYAQMIRKLLFKAFRPGEKTDFREVLRKSQEAVLELRRIFVPNLVGGGFVDDFFNNPARIYPLSIKATPLPWIDARDFWTFFTEPGTEIPWLVLGSLKSSTLAAILDEEYKKSGFLDSLEEIPQARLDYFLSGFSAGRSFPLENENRGSFNLQSQKARTQQKVIFQPLLEDGKLFLYFTGPLEKQPKLSLTLRLDGTTILKGLQNTENAFYFGTFLMLGSLLLISFPLSRAVTNPLLAISAGLRRVRSGDLAQDLAIPGRDQFALAARLFNEMIAGLREKEKISFFLSQMALRSLESGEKRATRREISILFCGIRNLEDISHHVESHAKLELINQFLSLFESQLKISGGSMDKFTGQAAIALFTDNKSQNSMLTMASQLRKELSKLNLKHHEEKLPILNVGMGIATGAVVLGPVGSQKRKDYTAIGATVNMAARLHSLGVKNSDITIHLDRPTREGFLSTADYQIQELSEVDIKGYSKKQVVYEVL